jgi:hypothetical protein
MFEYYLRYVSLCGDVLMNFKVMEKYSSPLLNNGEMLRNSFNFILDVKKNSWKLVKAFYLLIDGK